MAYLHASADCWKKYKMDEILLVSFIMANKYNYKEAYYDIYRSLARCSDEVPIDSLDKTTKNLALFYLLKANERGSSNAYYAVQEIFKDKKIP